MSKPKRSLEDAGISDAQYPQIIEDLKSNIKKKVYNYITGGLPVDIVRQRLYRNLFQGYDPGITNIIDNLKRVRRAVVDNKQEINTNSLMKEQAVKYRQRYMDDLFAEYLQIPAKQRRNFFGRNHLEDSPYKPRISKDNVNYKRIVNGYAVGHSGLHPTDEEKLVNAVMKGEHTNAIDAYNANKGYRQTTTNHGPVDLNKSVTSNILSGYGLGTHTISRGHDNKGEYVSYYDLWDMAPSKISAGNKDESMGIGKPVYIYDRIYLDDFYGVPNENAGGNYIPEIIVTGKRKKRKDGGSNNISSYRRSIEDAGKISDEEYYNIMERVAERNYKYWGFPNSDAALLDALNNNTYNYRGYYNKYPNGDGNAKDHWPDDFKTVYHPTFSNESIYSGKKSQYNPKGLKGGTWYGEYFVPSVDLLIERSKFKEGGESTNYINTIGLGYIFNKYGKKTIDFIRKRLYNNVLPWGYNDIPQRAYNAIVKNKKEVDETRDKALRDDLWATYLQIPKKERHNIKGGKVTLEKANYSPKGVNPNKEVYKFKDLLDVTKFGLLNYAGIIPYSVNFDSGEYLPIGKNRVVYPKDLGAFTELEGLGQFTVGRGYDKKGDYVSYYDSWDLGETNKNPYRDATFGIGKPFNVYDRIYLDDYFGVPNEHKGGIYLPEVLVTGTRKKHRNGGSIHIAPSKRGTFTAAATKHGMGVQEFASRVLKNKNSYSPAMVKKANFARNASKWNH